VGFRDRRPTIFTRTATTAGTILAIAALAGCGGGGKSSGVSSQVRDNYVAGCQSSGQTKAGCECLFDNLKNKQGVDTEAKFQALADKVKAATQSGNVAALPPEFRQAVLSCKSQIVKTQ
jgi:hypothetical protein